MRLHVAGEQGEVFYCPKCEHETLWPAYQTEEGLLIGFWLDFEPPDGEAGLLVCVNADCTYEEPITFADSPDDAVVWSWDNAWLEFSAYNWFSWPQTWIVELIEQTEALRAKTKQAKLQSLLDLYREQLPERQERIERWIAEATTNAFPVSFQAEEDALKGEILEGQGSAITFKLVDGEIRVIPKVLIWKEHIEYPRKPSRPHRRPPGLKEGDWIGFPLGESRYMVVEGHHVAYGEPTETGGFYVGRCWDAAVAEALRLREVAPGYWEGVFRPDEVERFYLRRKYVKIRGHWVREISRNEKYGMIWARTMDPAVAEALEMHPMYTMEGGEFGGWDGEIFAYDENFFLHEVEESRWEEEVQELPPDHWEW